MPQSIANMYGYGAMNSNFRYDDDEEQRYRDKQSLKLNSIYHQKVDAAPRESAW